jgi:hypothetical protein
MGTLEIPTASRRSPPQGSGDCRYQGEFCADVHRQSSPRFAGVLQPVPAPSAGLTVDDEVADADHHRNHALLA